MGGPDRGDGAVYDHRHRRREPGAEPDACVDRASRCRDARVARRAADGAAAGASAARQRPAVVAHEQEARELLQRHGPRRSRPLHDDEVAGVHGQPRRGRADRRDVHARARVYRVARAARLSVPDRRRARGARRAGVRRALRVLPRHLRAGWRVSERADRARRRRHGSGLCAPGLRRRRPLHELVQPLVVRRARGGTPRARLRRAPARRRMDHRAVSAQRLGADDRRAARQRQAPDVLEPQPRLLGLPETTGLTAPPPGWV